MLLLTRDAKLLERAALLLDPLLQEARTSCWSAINAAPHLKRK